MRRTTIFLPDIIKQKIEAKARDEGRSEAEVILEAVAARVDELVDQFTP